MALALLGGIARGQSLDVPNGSNVRPTSVMLRRKIFDAHQDMSGSIFIDLCAGTGAIGLEAWSRGAAQVILIEADQKTLRILQGNVTKLSQRFSNEVRSREIIVQPTKGLAWFNNFKQRYQAWTPERQAETVLFLDPPYEKVDIYQQVASLELLDWFKGRIWVESDRQKGLASSHWEIWGEHFVKTYTQGTSYVAVLDLREGLG